MDLAVILTNIERLLAAKKISGNKASALAGKPDVIRNIKRKLAGKIQGDGITVKTLDALARALGTTAAELQTPPRRITVKPIAGLKDSILAKIAWLDKEREQALRELEALEHAETHEKKRLVRKAR